MNSNSLFEKLDNGAFINSRVVKVGDLPYSVRDIVVKAPLIAGLNVYLIGATGEGKTQLAHDLQGYFGDSYCYMIGRPDFEPSELLKEVRLDKLNSASSDQELVQLTQNVTKNFFYVDELNRSPPIVQNYFFDFFDGKIVYKGKILPLGNNDYCLGYASGNIGDGSYVGISDSDRALKDRMHMIIKLDYPDYQTTPFDDLQIFSGKKDPRATLPQNSKGILDEILQAHKNFKARETPSILPLLAVYFTKGLDYLLTTKKHSKRAVDDKWPNVEGIRSDTDESKIFPLSKRAIFSSLALSQSLEMIAENKGYAIKDSTDFFLDSLRLTVPYSGVLAKNFVDNEYGGDVYSAFDAIMTHIRVDIKKKLPYLEQSLMLAEVGQTDSLLLKEIASDGRWIPVKDAIVSYSEYRKIAPSEKAKMISEILKKAIKTVK